MCFFDEKYLKLTKLQLISYVFFANTNINTDYLIITHKNFVEKIKSIINELNFFHKNINIFCLDLNTKHESCFSRYFIFVLFLRFQQQQWFAPCLYCYHIQCVLVFHYMPVSVV